jgi:hypothetical protein
MNTRSRRNFQREGAGRCAPGRAMDMWTMRLRRTGLVRGQRAALPTADPFAHMPTAFNRKTDPRQRSPAGSILP